MQFALFKVPRYLQSSRRSAQKTIVKRAKSVELHNSLCGSILVRGQRRYRQGMQACGEFVFQRSVDHALTLYPSDTGEPGGDDDHAIVAFAARRSTGVTGVAVGFILYIQARRRQRVGQLSAYSLGTFQGGLPLAMKCSKAHSLMCVPRPRNHPGPHPGPARPMAVFGGWLAGGKGRCRPN